MNKPYDTSSLTPLETLLLGRLSAMETMLGGVVRIVSSQLPTTRNNFEALVIQAGKSVAHAEESAAALLLYRRDHPITEFVSLLTDDKPLSVEEMLKLSEEPAKAIDEALAQYFPKSGISSAVGDIGHPVCIEMPHFLEVWKKPIPLPRDTAGIVDTLTRHISKAKPDAFFIGAMVHPSGNEEPLFVFNNKDQHCLVIAPARMTWYVMTFPDPEFGAAFGGEPFVHHQARVLDLKKALKTIHDAFNTQQPPKLKALLREHDDATTTIQVLLAEIFQTTQIAEVEVHRDYFHYVLRYDASPQGRPIVIVQRVMENGRGLQFCFTPDAPKHGRLLVGGEAVPLVLDDLQPQSKAILIEALTVLAKKVKPPKKTTKTATKAASKKATSKLH
jgi:hypothetical protein